MYCRYKLENKNRPLSRANMSKMFCNMLHGLVVTNVVKKVTTARSGNCTG